MKKEIFILSLAVAIAVAAPVAQAASQGEEQVAAIASCTPYDFKGPHPIVPGATRHVKVHGMVAGKCQYTETVPNNGLLTCNFTDEQRKQLGAATTPEALAAAFAESDCTLSGF